MNKVFVLRSINMTEVGAPMGKERTSENWMKLFKKMDSAKKFAEKDYKQPIKWSRGTKKCSSPDLSYVMYEINEEKVYN